MLSEALYKWKNAIQYRWNSRLHFREQWPRVFCWVYLWRVHGSCRWPVLQMCQLQIRFHLHRVVCRSPPSVSRGPTEFHGMHRMSRGVPWRLHGRGKSQSVIPLFYILFYCVCVCVCACVCVCMWLCGVWVLRRPKCVHVSNLPMFVNRSPCSLFTFAIVGSTALTTVSSTGSSVTAAAQPPHTRQCFPWESTLNEYSGIYHRLFSEPAPRSIPRGRRQRTSIRRWRNDVCLAWIW